MFMFNITNVEIISAIPEEDLNHIVDMVKRDNLNVFEKIGDGSYSKVFGYKDYAIKSLVEGYEFGDNCGETNDVQALRDLSHLDCVPKIYAVIDNQTMIVERIRGLTVKAVCTHGQKSDKIKVDDNFKKKFDDSLVDIMLSGYDPEDVHENNIIIEEGTNKPKIIDLGWFKKHKYSEEKSIEVLKTRVTGYSNAQSWAGNVINQYLDSTN